jgi:hypothetical protein
MTVLSDNMELPDDVLVIVREFSRPRFKYFREYKRILRLLRRKSFPELRDCLMNTPERILHVLVAYEKAYLEYNQLYAEYNLKHPAFISGKNIVRFEEESFLVKKREVIETRTEIFRVLYWSNN